MLNSVALIKSATIVFNISKRKSGLVPLSFCPINQMDDFSMTMTMRGGSEPTRYLLKTTHVISLSKIKMCFISHQFSSFFKHEFIRFKTDRGDLK